MCLILLNMYEQLQLTARFESFLFLRILKLFSKTARIFKLSFLSIYLSNFKLSKKRKQKSKNRNFQLKINNKALTGIQE